MISTVVDRIIQPILGKFIQLNIKKDDVRFGLNSFKFTINEASLREQALDSFEIPVRVQTGFIRTVELNGPVVALTAQPFTVNFDGVYVLLERGKNYDRDTQQQRLLFTKKLKLKLFGNNQIKLKEVEGQKSKENKSYFAGSITKIINNVQLNIRNVHIIYQATDNFGVPFLLGISFDSLAIQAANDDWQPGFVNGSNSMKKLITLTNFSVYWKKDEKITFVDNQQLAEDISKIDKEDNYLIEPLSFQIKLESTKNDTTSDLLISFLIEKIQLRLKEVQYTQIITTFDHFLNYSKSLQFLHLGRPERNFENCENVKEWWKYAVKGLQQTERDKRKPFQWSTMKLFIKNRKKFVKYYFSSKFDAGDKKQKAVSVLEGLEILYDVETLLYFKNIANLYLNYIEKLYNSNSAGGFSSYFSLNWIRSPKSEASTCTFATDFANFLQTLSADDLAPPPPNGTQKFEFKLNEASLKLVDKSENPLLYILGQDLSLHLERNPQNFRFNISLEDIRAEDLFTTNTQCKQITYPVLPGPFVAFTYNKDTEDNITLQSLVKPMNVTLPIPLYYRLFKFFNDPLQLKQTAMDIELAAYLKIKAIQENAKQKLNKIISRRDRNIQVDVAISAPNIFIPLDPTDQDSKLLLFSLGQFTCTSTPTSPFDTLSFSRSLLSEIDQQENFMHSEYKIKISEIFVNLSTIKEIAENETALTSSIGVNLLEKTDVDAAIKIITQANRSNTVIDVKMNDLKFKLKSMDTFYDLYRILNSILKCFQSIQQSNQNENKEDFIHLIHEDYKNRENKKILKESGRSEVSSKDFPTLRFKFDISNINLILGDGSLDSSKYIFLNFELKNCSINYKQNVFEKILLFQLDSYAIIDSFESDNNLKKFLISKNKGIFEKAVAIKVMKSVNINRMNKKVEINEINSIEMELEKIKFIYNYSIINRIQAIIQEGLKFIYSQGNEQQIATIQKKINSKIQKRKKKIENYSSIRIQFNEILFLITEEKYTIISCRIENMKIERKQNNNVSSIYFGNDKISVQYYPIFLEGEDASKYLLPSELLSFNFTGRLEEMEHLSLIIPNFHFIYYQKFIRILMDKLNLMKSQTQTEAKTQIQEATKEPSKFLFDLSLQNGAIELPRSAFNMEGLIIDLTKTVVFYEPFEGHNQLDAYWNMGIHYSYCHSHRTKQILAPASMKISVIMKKDVDKQKEADKVTEIAIDRLVIDLTEYELDLLYSILNHNIAEYSHKITLPTDDLTWENVLFDNQILLKINDISGIVYVGDGIHAQNKEVPPIDQAISCNIWEGIDLSNYGHTGVIHIHCKNLTGDIIMRNNFSMDCFIDIELLDVSQPSNSTLFQSLKGDYLAYNPATLAQLPKFKLIYKKQSSNYQQTDIILVNSVLSFISESYFEVLRILMPCKNKLMACIDVSMKFWQYFSSQLFSRPLQVQLKNPSREIGCKIEIVNPKLILLENWQLKDSNCLIIELSKNKDKSPGKFQIITRLDQDYMKHSVEINKIIVSKSKIGLSKPVKIVDKCNVIASYEKHLNDSSIQLKSSQSETLLSRQDFVFFFNFFNSWKPILQHYFGTGNDKLKLSNLPGDDSIANVYHSRVVTNINQINELYTSQLDQIQKENESLSLMKFDIDLNRIQVLISDDSLTENYDTPIFCVELGSFSGKFDNGKNKKQIEVRNIISNYYNLSLQSWQPFFEDSPNFTIEYFKDTNKVVYVSILNDSISLNVSKSLVAALLQVYKSFTNDLIHPNPFKYRSFLNDKKFSLVNKCGINVQYWFIKSQVYSLPANQSQTHNFKKKDSTGNKLSLELLDKIDEGVPITNNGVYKLFISEPESPYLVLLDIGFAQSSTKTITIRSNYIIDNQTELDLILHFGATNSVTVLQPNQKYFIPIPYLVNQSFTLSTSSNSSTQSNPITFFQPAKTPSCTVSSNQQHIVVSYEQNNLDQVIVLSPPLIIENLLPIDIEYSFINLLAPSTLRTDCSCPIYVDTTPLAIQLQVNAEHFNKSKVIELNFKATTEQEIPFELNKFYYKVSESNYGKRLTIFSKFYIVNNTRLPILYTIPKQRYSLGLPTGWSSKIIGGQGFTSENEFISASDSSIQDIFIFGEGNDTSDLSLQFPDTKRILFDSLPQLIPSTNNRLHYDFVIKRTLDNIVMISPKYLVQNQSRYKIYFTPFSLKCNNYLDNSLSFEPHSNSALHTLDPSNNQKYLISIDPHSYHWTGPLNISKAGEYNIISKANKTLQPDLQDKIMHFMVKFNEKQGTTNIIFSETIKPIFSIKNTTNYNIIASQFGSSHLLEVPPLTQVEFPITLTDTYFDLILNFQNIQDGQVISEARTEVNCDKLNTNFKVDVGDFKLNYSIKPIANRKELEISLQPDSIDNTEFVDLGDGNSWDFVFSLQSKEISVSVNDESSSNPTEILLISLFSPTVTLSESDTQRSIEFNLFNLQVDNQLKSTVFPVTFLPEPAPVPNQSSLCKFNANIKKFKNIIYASEFTLSLLPCRVSLDESLITALLYFVDDLKEFCMSNNSIRNSVVSLTRMEETRIEKEKWWFFDFCQIQPISMELKVALNGVNSNQRAILPFYLRVLGNLNGQLKLSPFSLQNVCLADLSEFFANLRSFYLDKVCYEIIKIKTNVTKLHKRLYMNARHYYSNMLSLNDSKSWIANDSVQKFLETNKIVTTFYFNKDGPLAGATGDRKIRRRLPRIIEPNTPLRKYNSNLAYCHYLVQKFGFTGERFELLAVIENTCCVLLTNKYLRYLNVDPTHVLWSCAIETIRGTQLTRSAIVVLASARHSIPAGQVLDLQNLYDTLLKSIFLIKYNRCF